MAPNSQTNILQAKLEYINLDLANYKVHLQFHNRKDPLIIHFDKPARRFYFSLIALIVTEMKNLDKPEFIYIRRHEKTLTLLDNALAGPNASKTAEGMWDKIRKGWRYTLPDLATGALFKVLDRNIISPYEKGGKQRYDCSEDECDVWANLFGYNESNQWRFKFAVDSASISLNALSVSLGDLRDNSAWQEFVKRLKIMPKPVSIEKRIVPRWLKKPAFALAAASIVVTVISAIFIFYSPPVPPTTVFEMAGKPSIAVLPFVNISEDPTQEYFSYGIAEEIINALVRWSAIVVIPKNSSFIYKGKTVKVEQVGREMGVRYVLEGSVRREENRVRVTVQLIDVARPKYLFSERYEREMKDIFAIQDDITIKVLTAMRISLSGEGVPSLRSKGTKNVEAYLKLLQAEDVYQAVNRDTQVRARRLAEEAIALDPEYARAYAMIAATIGNEVLIGAYENPQEALKRAMALSEKAVQLDDSEEFAHRLLGFIAMLNKDYEKGIAETKRAFELTPNSVMAQIMFGYALYSAGRTEEAIPILEKAASSSPIPLPRALSHLGIALRKAGRNEEAVAVCTKLIQIKPNYIFPHLTLAAAYAEMGKMERAHAEVREVMRIRPNYTVKLVPKSFPWKDQDELDRLADSLQKAGMK